MQVRGTWKNIIKWVLLGTNLVALLLFMPLSGNAVSEDTAQASILVDEVSYSISNAVVTVTVRFEDKSLYSNNVFLSFHTYDASGNLIEFENQRVAVALDDNNEMSYTFEISMKAYPEKTDVVVRFDLVDQGNVFWFSTNPEVRFYAQEAVCNSDNLKKPGFLMSNTALYLLVALLVVGVIFTFCLEQLLRSRKRKPQADR